MSNNESQDKLTIAPAFGEQAEHQARPASVLIVDEQQNVTKEAFDKFINSRGEITLVASDEVGLDAQTMAREKFERRLLGGSNVNIFRQEPN